MSERLEIQPHPAALSVWHSIRFVYIILCNTWYVRCIIIILCTTRLPGCQLYYSWQPGNLATRQSGNLAQIIVVKLQWLPMFIKCIISSNTSWTEDHNVSRDGHALLACANTMHNYNNTLKYISLMCNHTSKYNYYNNEDPNNIIRIKVFQFMVYCVW